MKVKILLSLCVVLLTSIGVDAQSITKLKQSGYHANFTPNGESIVFTSMNFIGLKKLDINSSELITLSSEVGAGYNDVLLDDRVLYQTNDDKHIVKEIEFATLTKKEEANTSVFALANSYNNSSKKGSSLPIYAKPSSDLFSIDLVYQDGMINKISTKQDENKIWVSLSPDRTKVLYTIVGGRTIVSDIKGKILASIDRAEAPKWGNDNTVVYMLTKEGARDYITKSNVFSFDVVNKKSRILTSKFDDIALYPAMTIKGDKVIFNNAEGELFLINLTK